MRLSPFLLLLGISLAVNAQVPRISPPSKGGFVVDLAAPDRFTAAQGTAAALDLWTGHIMATHKAVTVVGADLGYAWVKPLLDLKAARPEVAVVVLAARESLGPQGDVAAALHAGGVTVQYATKLAGMVNLPVVSVPRGLLLVRDGQSVLCVSGAAAEGWANAWLIESLPVAAAYTERVSALRAQLPRYPETRELLLSDH